MELIDHSARVGARSASTSILICRQVTLWQNRVNSTIRRSEVKIVSKSGGGVVMMEVVKGSVEDESF